MGEDPKRNKARKQNIQYRSISLKCYLWRRHRAGFVIDLDIDLAGQVVKFFENVYKVGGPAEALDIIDEVDRREVRILYDIYHSAVMDEKIEEALDGRIDRIVHVHIADHPGRHEPGSGTMDWRSRLEWLAGTTYPGMLGLEYKPTGLTEASLKTLLER